MPTLLSSHEIKFELHDLALWRQREYPDTARKRSSGVHLSGILRYVLSSIGKLKADDLADELPTVMCIGMAWENWYVGLRANEELIWQPGEWYVDKVYGTPDGLSFDMCGEGILEEFKFTYKSEHTKGKENITDQVLWIWQLAANCYAMSEVVGKRITMARLHVMWGQGDYRPPKPKMMQYMFRFEWAELEEFWRNVILKNRDNPGVRKERH